MFLFLLRILSLLEHWLETRENIGALVSLRLCFYVYSPRPQNWSPGGICLGVIVAFQHEELVCCGLFIGSGNSSLGDADGIGDAVDLVTDGSFIFLEAEMQSVLVYSQ
jgi:hypothetical protein